MFASSAPPRPSTPDHPSVIESLRVRGHEVQLGRVLAGLCADAGCARAFVRLLLRTAAKDSKIGARSKGLRVPRDIAAVGELHMTRRRPGIDQEERARADLFLSGQGFKITCELKINSDYNRKQLREYLAQGLVACVVRNPGSRGLDASVTSHRNWLGEVAWKDLAFGLAKLPVPGADGPQWLDLLSVLESDGDFERKKPPEINDEDRAFVLEVAEAVVDKLSRSTDARVRAFAQQVAAEPLFDRGPWARARIMDVEEPRDEYWRIRIKNCRMRTAEMGVAWMAWKPARSGQRARHRALQDKDFSSLYGGEQYQRIVSLDFRRDRDRSKQASEAAYRLVKQVVDVGLLEYDMDRLGIET